VAASGRTVRAKKKRSQERELGCKNGESGKGKNGSRKEKKSLDENCNTKEKIGEGGGWLI